MNAAELPTPKRPILIWTRADEEYYEELLALRYDVFVSEQGVPPALEVDADDLRCAHLAMVSPGDRGRPKVVGTLRLLLTGEAAKIGRVAVRRDCRRRGFATAMMVEAIQRAEAHRATTITLASQLDALALYERLGFAVISEPFLDANIPHIRMTLALAGP